MLVRSLKQKMAIALFMMKAICQEKTPVRFSLTLPLKREAYESNTLFSFFDGLIPEGWLLNVVAHNWKLDRRDRFGLLLVACRDTIGNVTIREVRE